MSARTYVIGVGMTKFDKPGTKEGDYPDWAKEAGEKALADAGIPYADVEQAYAGYCYGDSTYGQRALYQLGLTGIPVVNVNNNCSTGSLGAVPRPPGGPAAGSSTARSRSGSRRWSRARSGSSTPTAPTRSTSTRCAMFELRDPEQSPPAPQMFGNAGRDHMEKYGSKPDHYAWIGWKNHKHSVNNPYAQFQDRVLARRDQGRADDPRAADQAAVLADLRRLGVRDRRVGGLRRRARPLGPGGRDRRPVDGHRPLERPSPRTPTASRSSATTCRRQAADQAYEEAGISADDVDVCELHDCFSRQRADHLRGARLRRRGRGPQAGRGRGDHLRRRRPGRQPVGRADLARATRSGPPGSPSARELTWQLRGDGRRAPGRRREGRPAAQHRPRRRGRRLRLQAGTSPESNDEQRATSDEEQMTTTTNTSASPFTDEQRDFVAAIRDFCERECGTAGAARAAHRAATPSSHNQDDLREARRARLARGLDRRGVRRLGRRDGRRLPLPRGDHRAAWSRSAGYGVSLIVAGAYERFGTEEQKEEILGGIAAGAVEAIAMSEPEAGSDVGTLSCRGRASERRLRPQRPEDLDLAPPTSPTTSSSSAAPTTRGSKHEGLTMISVPTDAEGIEIRADRDDGRHARSTTSSSPTATSPPSACSARSTAAGCS